MAATRKVHSILTKYLICIYQEHYVIYLQNMIFFWFILHQKRHTQATHMPMLPKSWFHIAMKSWSYRLIDMYAKWAKNLMQGASFHRVTRLCYSKHLLHIADNSQVDRTFLFIFVYFNYFCIKAAIVLF